MRRLLLFTALSLSLLGALVYLHYANWSNTEFRLNQDVVLEFPRGSSLSSLTRQLANLGVLDQPLYEALYLKVLARQLNVAASLQAGEYGITSTHTPRQLLTMIARGQVLTYDLVIVDGITTRDLFKQLQNDQRLQTLAVQDVFELPAVLDFKLPFIEGAFLPETYQIRRGDTVASVLQRAHDALLAELSAAWQTRTFDSPVQNMHELLILASIIEKETGRADERAQISQVFHLRLNKNMRLQTDPTVIYAIGEDFDGDIKRRDLSMDSPYNTYRYRGLPPSPIALPSRHAIYAAAQPSSGDFLYFVARGDGSSQFSRTLSEHNRAVATYQLR